MLKHTNRVLHKKKHFKSKKKTVLIGKRDVHIYFFYNT